MACPPVENNVENNFQKRNKNLTKLRLVCKGNILLYLNEYASKLNELKAKSSVCLHNYQPNTLLNIWKSVSVKEHALSIRVGHRSQILLNQIAICREEIGTHLGIFCRCEILTNSIAN